MGMDPHNPIIEQGTQVLKICQDCKHYVDGGSVSFDRCEKRTLNSTAHLVRGNPKAAYGFCEQTRDNEKWCGKEGKWWEQK